MREFSGEYLVSITIKGTLKTEPLAELLQTIHALVPDGVKTDISISEKTVKKRKEKHAQPHD